MKPGSLLAAACVTLAIFLSPALAAEPLRALIVDGQNNHANWPQTTQMMKKYLEDSGLFTVDLVTHAPKGEDPSFKPAFKNYAVVVSNFGHGAAPWPADTRTAFEDYVRGGGGFVAVHAADNSFPEWAAYNQMIGLGGWGGRNEKSGPFVYYTDEGKLVRDTAAGPGGSHGPSSCATRPIRSRRACPPPGCMPKTNSTTASAAPRRTCRCWPRPTRRKPGGMSRCS